MLYHLFEYLKEHAAWIPGVGLFKFISFRAGMGLLLSLGISLIIGRQIIRRLQKLQIGGIVRDLGLKGENLKAGTPTMGGIIIIVATLIPCLLLAQLDNVYIILMIVSTLWMGTITSDDCTLIMER